VSKCPACNIHELHDSAWMSEMGGYMCKSDDHYNCANCGPMPKEYVDAVKARVDELEAENQRLHGENEDLRGLVYNLRSIAHTILHTTKTRKEALEGKV